MEERIEQIFRVILRYLAHGPSLSNDIVTEIARVFLYNILFFIFLRLIVAFCRYNISYQ